MKKTCLILSLILISYTNMINAQNVGIGTNFPDAKLHVNSDIDYVAKFNSNANGLTVTFTEFNSPRGYIGSHSGAPTDFDLGTDGGNLSGKLHFTIQGTPKMTIDNTGNIGVGITTPAYKMDVAGRMRLQNSGVTAGIWFDGTTLPTRSLIGTIDDNHIGIWGNAGAGWNIAMNVANGNTGIGTSAPTAKLDVNGSLRIRSSTPQTGSVLTSTDANGNVTWGDPIAFKTAGLYLNNNANIPVNDWTQVMFNSSLSYNLGAVLNPANSKFTAPEKGIYHFDTYLRFGTYEWFEVFAMKLVLSRNGVISTIGEYKNGELFDQGENHMDILDIAVGGISVDAALLPGDQVWVEVYVNGGYNYRTPTPSDPLTQGTLSSNPAYTWFDGHLVTRY